ncbi:Carbonic anhydrase [Mycena venus]|uniref:Carbonic anhydrase n=1 Tax=Mycena venus TaxID=2733690 RepID=A0A8H7CJP8_9AGAR|nr:Carbonic anhydrase [Mycena venus]
MIAQEFIEANEQYAANFTKPKINARGVIVVTCMDPRIHPYEQLGLKIGEAAIVRNAGGSAEDALNSILVAQYAFNTKHIAIVHHTDCGMTKFTTEWLRNKIKEANPGRDDVAKTVDGIDFHNFTDVEASVQRDLKYLVENPLVVKGSKVTGWVYDVENGKISQVGDVIV